MGDTPQLFPVLWGLWVFSFVRGELQTGRALGEQLLALADRVHDPALLLEAHLALGANLQQLGEVVAARTHLEQALALFDPQQHRAHAFLYGHDPQVIGLAHLACILWVLGYPDQARQRIHEAQTVVQTVDHSYSRGLVHFFAAWFSQLSRNPQATATQAETVLTLAHEHAFHYLAALGRLFQGWAIAMQGQAAEGIAQMRQGLAAYQALAGGVSLPHFLALLAEAYGHAGQTTEGLASWPRRWRSRTTRAIAGGKRSSIGSRAHFCCCSRRSRRPRQRPASTRPWTLPAARRRKLWSCARP